MEIVYQPSELIRYLRTAVVASAASPVLLDHFLDQAVEVDVDAVSDGKDVVIGAIMEGHRASWGAFWRLRLRPAALPLISRASGCDP